jgi:hypothetical protein
VVVDAEVNEKQEHSSERTEKCAQKEFDGADIVRDVRLPRWSQPVDATPSDMNLLSKGGVYDPSESGGAFCDAENRDMVPLEGGTVVA